jgi:hypothetical protein
MKLAEALAGVATIDDVVAWWLIATLHWARFIELFPVDEYQPDLVAALSGYVNLMSSAPHLVPEDLREFLTNQMSESSSEDEAIQFGEWAAQVLNDPYQLADPESLARAIDWLSLAVEATPEDHPNHGGRLALLCYALRLRFERTGMLADLDRATEVGQRAVAAVSADDPSRATILSILGPVYGIRFEHTGLQKDLDSAIQIGELAIAAIPFGDSEHAINLSHLSAMLSIRSERTGMLADMDRAVELGRRAVAAIGPNDLNRGTCLSNFSAALIRRFERTGALADLDEAIQVSDLALATIPADHPDRSARLSNFASALLARFGRTQKLDDLNRAIDSGAEAVATNPSDHPDHAAQLSNLGVALRDRFEQTHELTDIDAAIDVGQQAVAATSIDHPNRASKLLNLAASLSRRFEHTGILTDRDRALSTYVSCLEHATGTPMVRAQAGRAGAALAADAGDWATAHSQLVLIISLLPSFTDMTLSPQDRQYHLRQLQGLGQDAARAVLGSKSNEGRRRQSTTAWQYLDQARTVLLTQALEIRTTAGRLQTTRPDLAIELDDLRKVLASGRHDGPSVFE